VSCYYVTDLDGYQYDPEHDSLRMATGEKIGLLLYYTCKGVAGEMHGLALELNNVTFRTVLDAPPAIEEFSRAALFKYCLYAQ
jgi:hypothetical protein